MFRFGSRKMQNNIISAPSAAPSIARQHGGTSDWVFWFVFNADHAPSNPTRGRCTARKRPTPRPAADLTPSRRWPGTGWRPSRTPGRRARAAGRGRWRGRAARPAPTAPAPAAPPLPAPAAPAAVARRAVALRLLGHDAEAGGDLGGGGGGRLRVGRRRLGRRSLGARLGLERQLRLQLLHRLLGQGRASWMCSSVHIQASATTPTHRAGVQGVMSRRPHRLGARCFEVLALVLVAPRPVQPPVLRAAVRHRPARGALFELADGHLSLVAAGEGAD